MVKVNVRDLVHHFADYLEQIKKGERIVVLHHRIPVADIIPHNENIEKPGWKRDIKRIHVKGLSISKEVERYRDQER